MVGTTNKERLAVIETQLETLHGDVKEIKNALKEHIDWEITKYDKLDEKYSGKWIEKYVIPAMTAVVTGIIIFVLTTT